MITKHIGITYWTICCMLIDASKIQPADTRQSQPADMMQSQPADMLMTTSFKSSLSTVYSGLDDPSNSSNTLNTVIIDGYDDILSSREKIDSTDTCSNNQKNKNNNFTCTKTNSVGNLSYSDGNNIKNM